HVSPPLDHIAYRSTKPLNRRDNDGALRDRPGITDKEHSDRVAVNLPRQPWRGRSYAQHSDAGKFWRGLFGHGAVHLEPLVRVGRRPGDRTSHHFGAHRAELVLEAGYNTKVAASSAQPPEQILVFVVACAHDAPLRGDNLHGKYVVTGPAESARQ